MPRTEVGVSPLCSSTPEYVIMRERVKREREERLAERLKKKEERRTAPKIPFKSMEFALRTHGGNISDAAHFLGITAKTLRLKVEKSSRLKEVIQEVTEQLLDFSESVIAQSILSGNVSTSMWYLKTKGKERGYTEKVTNELELGEKSLRSADELIKAMRESKKELEALEGGEVKWLERKLLPVHQEETTQDPMK